jgi:acetyltransferase-like isoleucine patch superfamily enzyme
VTLLARIPKVRRLVIEAQTMALDRLHPGTFGPGLRVYGWPIVDVVPGSTLRIGCCASLISDPFFSEGANFHPVCLRTLHEGAEILIGDDVGMNGVTIAAVESVRIGNGVLMGANATVVDTDFHPLAPKDRHRGDMLPPTAPTTIGDNVFLGYNSLVLKGVTIGRDAVVSACSVVVRDVPAGAIVAGNPARFAGWLEGYGD